MRKKIDTSLHRMLVPSNEFLLSRQGLTSAGVATTLGRHHPLAGYGQQSSHARTVFRSARTTIARPVTPTVDDNAGMPEQFRTGLSVW